MKKLSVLCLILLLNVFAKDINSQYTLSVDGNILAMMVSNGKIYVSTDSSVAEIFDAKSKKLEKVIKFEKIKDFLGSISDTRIFSIDKDGNRLLFVSQGEEGFSRVYLYYQDKNHLIFDKKDKLPIVKAKFISKDKIILALLGSRVLLYDLKNKKFIYDEQISQSKFSDFALNQDKSKMVLSDESGKATLLDTKNGKIIKTFDGQNLDNVYQVDYKNHTIAVASKDRRCGIYKENGSIAYHKSAKFMFYSVGLSQNGKLCGYPSDFANNITVFDVDSKSNLYRLVGDKSTISNIKFVGNKSIFTTSKNKIKFWKVEN
ncbi:MAG: WD40 repeat domain-containing protein [Campylobacteraceae bacterium]|nr:WD40 repeat domain-containing protein [Campylobacteraceae bacterium]